MPVPVVCSSCQNAFDKTSTMRFCPFCGSPIAEPQATSDGSETDETPPATAQTAPHGGHRADPELTDLAELMTGDVVYETPAPGSPPLNYQTRIAMMAGGGVLLAIILLIGIDWLLRGNPGGSTTGTTAALVSGGRPGGTRPLAPLRRPEPFGTLPGEFQRPEESAPAALPPVPPIPIEFAPHRPAWAGLQALPSATANRIALSEAEIEQALERGAEFLVQQFDGSTLRNSDREGTDMAQGLHALVTSALLHASMTIDDPRLRPGSSFMDGLLDRLATMSMDGSLATYSRSVRMSAMSVAARPQDQPVMQADLQWLIESSRDGAFGYGKPFSGNWDNSNTQYGVLGIWAAADAGLAVPATFWDAVERHWTQTQISPGGWAYKDASSTPTMTMTAAGVTSMFLASQRPGSRETVAVRRGMSEPLRRGLDWLEEGDNAITLVRQHTGYSLYGIERAGLASGYRMFGSHDWFLRLAPDVIGSQEPNGSWNPPSSDGMLAETAFRMLFLSRGIHPVLATKLRFDGSWANRPNDLHDLTRFASAQLERQFNWQVVPVHQDWKNWTGSPLLYISSDAPPTLTDADRESIRQFVLNGGMLFTHAEKGSADFNAFAESLAQQLFPHTPLVDAPDTHPIFSIFARPSSRPALKIVDGGARPFMVHSPVDVSVQWDKWTPKRRGAPAGLEMGLNVAVYAGGKTPYRSRLGSTYEQEPQVSPIGTIPVAQIRHSGTWNPEPEAWNNYGRWFLRQTSISLAPREVDIALLNRREYPLAHLTSTKAFALNADEADALRAYVDSGGVLLIDAAGGTADAAASIPQTLLPALRLGLPTPLTPQNDLLRVGPSEVPRVEARLLSDEDPATIVPPSVYALGKGFVIVSDRDLVTALLGASLWDIRGYAPAYVRPLVRNLLLAVSDKGARERWESQ